MKRLKLQSAEFKPPQTPNFGDPGIEGLLVAQVGFAKGHFCVEENGRLMAADPSNPEHAGARLIPIFLDQQTISQFVESGNSRPEIKCKLKHGDIDEIIGGYTKFRQDTPDRVIADLRFMEKLANDRKDFVIELARRFATEVGNSTDFLPSYELGQVAGKKIALARCKKLSSVDIVDTPAATSALFEEPENQPTTTMPLEPEVLSAITSAVEGVVNTKFEALDKRLNARFEEIEKKDDDDDEKKKKDEEAAEKMSADIAKRAGEEVQAQLQKLTGGKPLNLGNPGAKESEAYDDAVNLALQAGCKTKGEAIQFVAKNKPDVYNAHMKAQNK